ncbi:hypothetical protein ACF06X_14715 [Streptomyces sp. NPDC015346]
MHEGGGAGVGAAAQGLLEKLCAGYCGERNAKIIGCGIMHAGTFGDFQDP